MASFKLRDLLAVGAIATGLVVMYGISTVGSKASTSPNASASTDQPSSTDDSQTGDQVNFALNNPANAPTAPDFTLESMDGKTITLSDAVKHGPVLIDFWATWCGPCKMELPMLSNVYDKYKSKGVQIYALNVDTDKAGLTQFFVDAHPDCPVLIDTNQTVGAAYSVDALPSMFLIDQNMKVRASIEGADMNTESDLPVALDKLLQGA
jgi:thiol-disulfide isomerase/thioredoxin